MVRSNAVAKHRQHARALDLFHGRGLDLHVIEIWRPSNISGVFLPGIGLAFRDGEAAPALVSLENFGVAFREHIRGDRLLNRLFHFALRRPEVREIDGLAVFALADSVFAEVGVDASGQRKSDYQRRRHQIVGPHLRVDAPFEIAIAGEHRSDDQFFLIDGLRNFGRQRPGIADASGASVTDNVKFQFLEIRRQARILQIIAHNFRSRRKRSLHPGRY